MKSFLLLFSFSVSLLAANWVMLQGTESKVGNNPWGFAQVRAEHNEGTIFVGTDGKNKTPFSYIRPNLREQEAAGVARFRLGLRGSLTDDNNINYFLLTEFGTNGITQPLDSYQNNHVTDASITLRYLPVYIRIGKFKYAGSEEGNMARFVSPFIHFSTVGDQLMLERYIDTSKTDVVVGSAYQGKPSQGVGAYRDSGIQLFQSLDIDATNRVTLAYMLGNGSGLSHSNENDGYFTHYAYLSYEAILGGGKGYFQEAFKVYGWYQSGKRLLYANGSSELYDRVRYGAGITYFANGFRLGAEYLKGQGMIVSGAKDINSDPSTNQWEYMIQTAKDSEADGYYILSTYELLEQFDIIGRYDVYHRMTNSEALLREFQTLSTGVSYRFNSKNRLDFNYLFNSIRAPHNSRADRLLKENVGNLISLQYTIVVK